MISLLVGTDLLQKLLINLLRFREHRYAVSEHTEGMFIQVGYYKVINVPCVFLHGCLPYVGKNPETALLLSRNLIELLQLGGSYLTSFASIIRFLSLKKSPKTSANNSKVILTAAINPETASYVHGLKWNHVTDRLAVSRGINCELIYSATMRSVPSFVSLLAKLARPSESGQGDGATLTGGEKENLIPPMLLAGLTTAATRSKKSARTLEMEVISQCAADSLNGTPACQF